jgi:molybdopterin-guanine dinucleotide biosynthesis protein A
MSEKIENSMSLISPPKLAVSSIILAGGKNSRFGQEKAFLRIGKTTIIEEQIHALSKIFDEIIIVTNKRFRYKNLDVKVVTDIIPDSGPLGGLYSGLAVSSNIHCFLIGCDMPFVNLKLIKHMIDRIGEKDIIIPESTGGKEALYAIYSINCLETIKHQVENGHLRLVDILKFHKVEYISNEDIKRLDPEEDSFYNVNSPSDYEQALRIWAKWK